MKTILSIKESPRHPKLSSVYQQLEIHEDSVTSIRKANTYLKKNCPDLIVAEFFYGYGSNYSGVHISNLDMLFVTLQKYQCDARVIAFVDKDEKTYIHKLIELFPLHDYFVYPITVDDMKQYLSVFFSSRKTL